MKICGAQIKALDPCEEGWVWYQKHGTEDLLDTLLRVNATNSSWALWLIGKLMADDKRKSVALAVFAAEMSIEHFEREYPDDKRVRGAIEAAKAVLKEDTVETRSAALSAESAARSAAWSAAWSAESAAESAESAVWSAARSAARSAESAARSAVWSAARSAARSAESAAWSAAESAAWSAESAESAAWSAESAESAARSAALIDAQEKIIQKAVEILGS